MRLSGRESSSHGMSVNRRKSTARAATASRPQPKRRAKFPVLVSATNGTWRQPPLGSSLQVAGASPGIISRSSFAVLRIEHQVVIQMVIVFSKWKWRAQARIWRTGRFTVLNGFLETDLESQ